VIAEILEDRRQDSYRISEAAAFWIVPGSTDVRQDACERDAPAYLVALQ
jgi:hypothetical protein